MSPKNRDNNGVFDVSKPGHSPPDSSSRPLIVGHRNILSKDPMVSGEDALAPKEATIKKEDHDIKNRLPEKVIKADDNIKPNHPPKDALLVDAKVEQKEDETNKATESNEETEEPPKPVDNQGGEEDAEDSKKTKTTQNLAISDEEQARQEKQKKLIEDKTYFLPVTHNKKRRSATQFMITFVIVLAIGLILIYLAIATGFIKSSVQLPFGLIKN